MKLEKTQKGRKGEGREEERKEEGGKKDEIVG